MVSNSNRFVKNLRFNGFHCFVGSGGKVTMFIHQFQSMSLKTHYERVFKFRIYFEVLFSVEYLFLFSIFRIIQIILKSEDRC